MIIFHLTLNKIDSISRIRLRSLEERSFLLPTKEGQEQILVNYKIKTPDAIVAATAMVHGFNLVTQNE